jgi:N-acetylglutamate synthase-like GNAT family acetyltransferase
MTDIIIRYAMMDDFPRIKLLLQRCHLVTDGLFEPGTQCWLIEEYGKHAIVGIAAIELGDNAGLLRSVGIDPVFRRQGLGAALTNTAFEGCRMAGRHVVYCFSTGAGAYWQRFGFREVSVNEVISALPDSPQVNHFGRIGWLPTEIAWRKDL